MHSRLIWTVFALVLLCVYVEGSDNSLKCKKHEIFTLCGAYCERSCEYPEPRRCPKICVKGCVCTKGYVRDKNHKCIPLSECPKRDYPK